MPAPLFVLLVFGSPLFLALSLALLCVVAWATEDEPGLAGFLLVAYLVVATLFTDANLIRFVPSFGHTVLLVATYVLFGAVWSFVKWLFLNLDCRENYKKHVAETPNTFKTANDFKPKAIKHKTRIIGWIAYWPLSVVRFLCGDMLFRIANRIYQLLSRQYEAVTTWVFSGLEEPTNAA